MYIPVALPLSLYVHMHVFIFVQLFWEIELLCYYHYMLSWIYIILYPWQHFTVEGLLLKNSDFEKWLGKKDCSGGKDYVLCHQSLQFDSLLFHKTVNFRQVSCSYLVQWLWFGKQILHVKKSCYPKLQENYKNVWFFPCAILLSIERLHSKYWCGFSVYRNLKYIPDRIKNMRCIFFIIKKALHDALKGNDWKGER